MKSPLLLIGIVLVLVLSAGLIVPVFIDWTQYRGLFEQTGSRLTGRQVEISGPVSLRIIPFPHVRLNKVSIRDSAGAPPRFTADSVDIRLALPRLLHGELSLTHVAINNPTFVVERTPNGQWSWAVHAVESAAAGLTAHSIVLDDLAIANATVIVHDRRLGKTITLAGMDADISASSLNGPFHLNGKAQYNGRPLNIALSLGQWRKDETLAVNLRAHSQGAWPLIYTVDATLDKGFGGLNLSGKLSIKSDPPQTESRVPSPNPWSGFSLGADITARDTAIQLDTVEITVPGQDRSRHPITGQVGVRIAPIITVRADLQASRLSLDGLMDQRDWNVMAEPDALLTMLRRITGAIPDTMDLSVSFKAASLTARSQRIADAELIAEVNETHLALKALSGSTSQGGHFDVSGFSLAQISPPQFHGTVELDLPKGQAVVGSAFPVIKSFFRHVPAQTPLSLKGAFDLSPGRIRLSDATFRLHETNGTISLDYAAGQKSPSWTAHMRADTLNLNRYLPAVTANETPEGDGATHGPVTACEQAIAEILPDIGNDRLAGVNIVLDIKLDRLICRNVDLHDVAVDLMLDDGNIDLRHIGFSGEGDSHVEMQGFVRSIIRRPEGQVEATIAAQNPLPLSRLAGLTKKTGNGPVSEGMRHLAPLHATAVVHLQPAGDGDALMTNLNLEATAGSLSISGRGAFKGGLTHWSEATITVNGGPSAGKPGGFPSWPELYDREPGSRWKPNRSFRLEGTLLHRDGIIKFDPLRGVAAGSAIMFSGTADLSASPLRVEGKLRLDHASLPSILDTALMPPEHMADAGEASAETGAIWPTTPFALNRLNAVIGNLDVTARRLRVIDPLVLKDASFNLVLGDGRIKFDAIRGLFDGKPVQLGFIGAAHGENLIVSGQIAASALPIDRFLRLKAHHRPALNGTLGFKAHFTASGRSPAGLVARLSGEGDYRLGDCEVSGLDPAAFATSIAQAETLDDIDTMIGAILQSGWMNFADTSGHIHIENGLFTFDNAKIEGDGVSGHAEGNFSPIEGLVDMVWRLKLDGLAGVPSMELVMSGPPNALEPEYRTARLRNWLAADMLQKNLNWLEQLNTGQKRNLDNIGSKNSGQTAHAP
ncbi:MAG: AsmA family protein [Hyphomicrobiales bacterium]